MRARESVKSDDVRKEIIIKTREIISRLGYRKSSTEEIARAMNKTKGALYHYFENREELIKAVIDYEGQRLKEFIILAVSAETDPEGRLKAFFLIRAKKVHELVSYYKPVKEEYFNRYAFIMDALGKYSKDVTYFLEDILREGVKLNLFFVPNVSLASRALIKCMEGFDFFLFQGEDYKKIKSEITEALRIFLKGIAKD
jgi:AcrR family transcriptional regulator